MERPRALLVYCILSWIYMGYYLIENIINLIHGPLTPFELREVKLSILKTVNQQDIAFTKESIQGTIDTIELSNQYHYVIEPLNFVAFVIGIIGVYLMFQLRKVGYYLYLLYSIIPIGLAVYFIGGTPIGNIGIVVLIFFSVLFSVLYGLQLKNMR